MKRVFGVVIMMLVMVGSVNLNAELLPTSLAITVIDNLGNIQKGAKVALYDNEDDLFNEEDAIDQGRTDNKGRITFKKLKPKVYYVRATQGKKTNEGEAEITGKLISGRKNKVNIVIR